MSGLRRWMIGPPRWTLAVAESLTGGNVQAAVTAESGASAFFLGGITAYTLEQKVRHLGVDRARASAVNCVSAGVATEMARGVCGLFGSDWGAATTGYAEASPADGVTVPHAYWALAWRRGVTDGVGTGGERGDGWGGTEGFVDGSGLGRVAMQRAVTEVVLAGLRAELARARNGG